MRQFAHVYLRLERGGKAIPLCIFSFNFPVIKCVMSVSDNLIEGSVLCCCEITVVLSRYRRVASTKQNDSQTKFYSSGRAGSGETGGMKKNQRDFWKP